jgi:predicted phage terminase large subunit-like protein
LETELPDFNEVEQALAELKLRHYIEQAWSIVVPSRPLLFSWHMDAICEHLEAVTMGQIGYLLINVPPRHTKSLSVDVFWPTWEWGPRGMPHLQYLCSSYAQGLSTRDALRSRRLMQSDWYQQRWGDIFYFTSDQNQKIRYDNNWGGYRIATSVGGLGTGEGGDRIIADDPHNVVKVESETERSNARTWWDESMANRINDEDTGAYIMIMQRSHSLDLAGHIQKKAQDGEIDLVQLVLPARYEAHRKAWLSTRTPLDFEDPRTVDGEPLDQLRYPEPKLRKLEQRMTEYSRAGQLQQRPAPRGGGMFKERNFIRVKDFDRKAIIRSVRYWDKAATEDGGKRTAGVLMHKLEGGSVIVENVVKGQWSTAKREQRIKSVGIADGYLTSVFVEQEPGAGGKDSARMTVKMLAGVGLSCKADLPTGDKEARAEPWAAAVENGFAMVLDDEWTEDFIREHKSFPTGEFVDQVDAASGAYNRLHLSIKEAGAIR